MSRDVVPRYFSMSQLSSADPTESGCNRRWFYDKGEPSKSDTEATTRGTALHAELAEMFYRSNR